MQTKQKIIMILGAGQMQVPVIKKCNELGLFSISVDLDKNAPGFQFSDISLIISTHNKDAILEAAQEYKIDGILTTSDFPVRSVAYVCEELGLVGLNTKAAQISTNKFLLREELKKTTLDYPQYIQIITSSELLKVDFFPAIVKPVDASASRGVKKVNSYKELKQAYKISKSFSNSEKVIVEQFIEGKEYSVEAITIKGKTHIIAITEKKIIGQDKGYFVEYSHNIPANITPKEAELIENTTKELIKVIELDNSSSHTEIILSKDKAYVVEIGARLGGDFIASDLVYQSTGVDMLESVIKIAIGEKVDVERKHKHFSGIQFITPKNYKSAEKYINDKHECMVKYQIDTYKNIEITNSLDRLGYIIASSNNKSELETFLSKINED